MSTDHQQPLVPERHRSTPEVGRQVTGSGIPAGRARLEEGSLSQIISGKNVRAPRAAGATDARAAAGDLGVHRAAVLDRERERYGGVMVGSAFFGWLAATGTAVLLTAFVAATGAAVGAGTDADPGGAVPDATGRAGALGMTGGITLLVIPFLAYSCGGYVAGRMARFDGLRQGVAVWVWAILVAAVVALVATVAGSAYDVLDTLNAFPRIPTATGELTIGVVALLSAAAAALSGAVVGGLAGMRFHRTGDGAGPGS